MQRLLCSILALFLVGALQAQINTPAPSPYSKIHQTVGLTDVTVEYSRPAVKGRTLFVDVEAWGQTWRTGANAATKVTFSQDVKLNGKEVKAGTYALYSIPGQKEFTVMLYNDLSLGGNVAKYDETKEAVRFMAPTKKAPMFFENFTIHFNNLKAESGEMALLWGNYYVPIDISAPNKEKIMKQIDMAMAGPTAGEYFTAASYYLDNKVHLDKALTYIRKANEMRPDKFWMIRREALILAELGKYKEAVAAAEKSKQLATEAKNDGYIKMNTESIAKWKTKI